MDLQIVREEPVELTQRLIQHTREILAMVGGTPEFAEAVDSAREGRPPRWTSEG